MSTLEIDALECGYSEVQVLWGVSLDVGRGEVVALLGANGVGKTTLARALSGTISAWSGRVTFNGQDITKQKAALRAKAGLIQVPQGRRVFPDLTVKENLEVGLHAVRDKSVWGRQRGLVIDIFPKLAELQNRLAGSLSGGEQQMLAVGRALMANPQLIVFDEPSLGLSPVMVQALYGSIERICELGVSVLLIEQLVGPALAVANRVAVLEAGRIAAFSTPDAFQSSGELARRYLGAS